ncbi:hypothetical protein G6F65_021811 [Rhizopus arrhizus]|nr:hypothetical protein G6F65_021811 [Rhizopus arrhizus]
MRHCAGRARRGQVCRAGRHPGNPGVSVGLGASGGSRRGQRPGRPAAGPRRGVLCPGHVGAAKPADRRAAGHPGRDAASRSGGACGP